MKLCQVSHEQCTSSLICSFFSFLHTGFNFNFILCLLHDGNFIVDLNGKPAEKNKGISNFGGPVNVTDLSTLKREHLRNESREPALQMKNNAASDGFRLNVKGLSFPPSKIPGKEFDNSGSDSETRAPKDPSSLRNLGRAVKGKESHSSEAASELPLDAAADLTLPTEVNY